MSTTSNIALACEPRVVTIQLSQILPLKRISARAKSTEKWQRIVASVEQLGVIEPLVVYPDRETEGRYILLDGHLRMEALLGLKATATECLIASDDEAFTYNHKVNRLSAIQEHLMILKAIHNGVPEARIAATLHVDVAHIRRKRDLLVGICDEAVALLKDTRISANAVRELRKVKPMRQIEMAELMNAAGNYSVAYTQCLVAATADEQLVDSAARKEGLKISAEDLARIEREMETLSGDFRRIEKSHGQNVLHLVVVLGYLKSLLDNARVVRFLSQNYADLLTQFSAIAESRRLQDELSAVS